MNSFIKIGTILKTKGFDGTTLVVLDTAIIDSSIKAVFIQKGNMYSPLIIEKLTKIDDYTLHIKWANYSSKEQAQTLNNREIFINETLLGQFFDEELSEDLVGYAIYNLDENIGEVIAIYQNNHQETLEIKLSNDKMLLVPLIDEYVMTIDDDKMAIYCQLTEDYIELFSN
jgi:16S rRNA processing protein RimM